MSEAKSPKTPAWRVFEKLVARIERAAAPRNAIVKSPDRIADIVTGTLREVDASIRFTIGTVPVLITIECRKRKPSQDVTWIEQLIAKRQHLGAAQTIAVASAGFSEEAEAKALPGGIVLRQLENVSREDIETWLTPESVIYAFRQNRLFDDPIVEFYQSVADKGEIALLPEPEKTGVDAKVFIKIDGEPISLNDIWLLAQDQKDFYKDISWQSGEVQKKITLRIPKGSLRLETTAGVRNVARIMLSTELWYGVEEVPLGQGDFHRYRYTGPGGVEIQRTEFTVQLHNLDMKVAQQGHKDSREVSFEVTIKPQKSAHD